jgi:uncharacterized membrane protein YesL
MKHDFLIAFKLIGTTCKLWWGDWVNQVLVSLVAVLLSLTVILAPPSLMGIMLEMQDLSLGNRTGIAGFWQGFKRYFGTGWLWGGVNLLALAVLVVNIWFYGNMDSAWSPILVVFLIFLALFWFVMQFYSLGYFFEQEEKSFKLAWKNGFLTVLAAPVFTLVIGVFALLITILSLGTFLPLLVGSPALLALLSLLAVQNRLIEYKKTPVDAEGLDQPGVIN